MAGVNKVILIGNLGKDPEIFTTESGIKRAKFSIATTESYKGKDGNKVEETEWHNIILWRGLAEVAEKYVRKGSKVYLEGKIKTRSYDDKDGSKRYITEIYGDNMMMLDSRRDSDFAPPPPPPGGSAVDSSNFSVSEPEDDLPF
ncbi:MAG: single-stranded DNA-binding protein [Bacteroidota bacterium]